MAQIKNGILGGFTGRVGTVSGYSRYGRNIMRVAVSSVKDKATPARLGQREKIKVCNFFIKPFSGTGFFTKTFPNYGHGGSGYNRAMGILMNKALTGSYPTFTITYDKFLISNGPLPSAENVLINTNQESNIVFSWADTLPTGTAKATDKVVLAAYFIQSRQIIFSLDAGDRSECQAILKTNEMKGYTAQTWIGFLSKDGSNAANSVYAGSVVV